jgi:hypothetical protein
MRQAFLRLHPSSRVIIGAVRVTQIEKKGKQNRRVRLGWVRQGSKVEQ